MSAFLRRLLEHKKYFFIMITITIISGVVFGFFEYHYVSKTIQDFFKNLFYLNREGYTNQYQMFVLQNGIYILICTYLSTSYLGYFGIMALLFLKGVQLSFSLLFVFSSIPFSFVVLILIILEAILEIIFCVVSGYMGMYISAYVFNVTFFVEQNFNMKSMLNYKLNYLIVTLLLFSLLLAFRMYVVPMF